MGFINKLRSWFTAKRRQSVYAAVAAIVPVLVMTGTITDDQTQFVLKIASAVLSVIAGLLQLVNLSPAEVGREFLTSGRAAIYTLAMTAAPAAVGLHWISTEQSAHVLTIVSVGLTVLSAILGVVFLTPDAEPATSSLPSELVAVQPVAVSSDIGSSAASGGENVPADPSAPAAGTEPVAGFAPTH